MTPNEADEFLNAQLDGRAENTRPANCSTGNNTSRRTVLTNRDIDKASGREAHIVLPRPARRPRRRTSHLAD